MAIGHFNAKSSKCHCQDKSIFEGNVVVNITSHFGLHQAIIEPMHIFTSLPNLLTDSGVQSSQHPNCYHQIVYAKFNLAITCLLLICEEFGTTKILILNLFEQQQETRTSCVVTITMIYSISTSV